MILNPGDDGRFEPVYNGGFDTGLAGWTDDDRFSRGSLGVTPGPGDRLLTLDAPAAFPDWGFSAHASPVWLDAGQTYVLSGFLRLEGDANLYLDLLDAPGEPNVLAARGVDGWQFVHDTFTPTVSGLFTPRVVMDWCATPAQGWADDIAFTRLDAFSAPSGVVVPEPGTTAAAFGLSLAAWAIWRRRQRTPEGGRKGN